MHTLYLWRCTSPITGRRYTTRYQLSDEDARSKLIDPERVEYGAIEVGEPLPLVPSGTFTSGLVMNANGAMVDPER